MKKIKNENMKKLIILIFVVIITGCNYETPQLNDDNDPFIITSIEKYTDTHSHYISKHGGDVGNGLFSGIDAKITLPTGMYNIGDTITIKK